MKLREVFKKAKPPSQNFNQVLFPKEEKKTRFPLFYSVKTGKNGITVFYSLVVVKKHKSPDACSIMLYNWDKWGYFEGIFFCMLAMCCNEVLLIVK